jgi:hypothetical protein
VSPPPPQAARIAADNTIREVARAEARTREGFWDIRDTGDRGIDDAAIAVPDPLCRDPLNRLER